MNEFLQTPIEFLKGVGPQRAQLLKKEAGIYTFDDLLNYFPFRYVDRSQYHSISELPTLDGPAQLKGMIIHVSERQVGKQTRLKNDVIKSKIENLFWLNFYETFKKI